MMADGSVASVTPARAGASSAPRLAVSDGTLNGIKWLALLCMTLDHVNKYLLHDSVAAMFDIGRLTMPLFAFALGFNLARPDALARGIYGRVAGRLAIYGGYACGPFVALGGLGWGWWPLNVMAMLLVATVIAWLLDRGGAGRIALAGLLFVAGGSVVEFWWPGVAACLFAWAYCRRPSWARLACWTLAIAALYVVNRNLWALAALPVIFAAPHVRINLPRAGRLFYVYYPAHLAALWLVVWLAARQT